MIGEAPDSDQLSLLSQYVTKPYRDFWDGAVPWAGRKVFAVEIECRPAGSGDTTWNVAALNFCPDVPVKLFP